MSLKVKGHSPSQEKIARLLSGIEGVPAQYARRMVSNAAKVGWENDQEIARLRREIDDLRKKLEGEAK